MFPAASLKPPCHPEARGNVFPWPTAGAIHPAFAALARCVRERFAATGHAETAFPEVAVAALEQARLPERLDTAGLLEMVLLSRGLPAVVPGENEFGYPTLTVVREERFRIEIIFWRAGVARTHHHDLCGAFQVLAGPRLQNEYRFDLDGPLDDALDLGQLERTRTTLLQPGDIWPIPPGEGLIHDLAFLAPFCLTVTVRNTRRPPVSHCQIYAPPHLRFAPGTLLCRRELALETLHHAGGWPSPALVLQVVRSSPAMAYALLSSLGESPALGALAAEAVQAHGEVGRRIAGSVSEMARRKRLTALLRSVPNGPDQRSLEQRLLLGLAYAGLDRTEAARFLPDQLPVIADSLQSTFGPSIVQLSPLFASPAPVLSCAR